MTQAELNQAVASATGESISTIARMGFVELSAGPIEREPQMIDWDELQSDRPGIFPPTRRRSRVA